MINYLTGEKFDFKTLDKLSSIHVTERATFLPQLQVLKSISLSLDKKITCLQSVHHSERDDFAKHITSLKVPVENYEPIMLDLNRVHFADRGAFINDLNRIGNMYYFKSTYDYKQIEKIDEKLIVSLRNVSSTPEERSTFVTLVLDYLAGQKLDSGILNQLASVHVTERPIFLPQLQGLKTISLSLDKKIICLQSVHHSERNDFAKHVASIKVPVENYEPIMLELSKVHFADRGAFVNDLNRIGNMYYFTSTYNYNKVDKIDEKLIEALLRVSSVQEERTTFVTHVLNYLTGEKLDAKTLDKLSNIDSTELSTFLSQLNLVKSIPITLENKIDCLNAVHPLERDGFIKNILAIKGPIHDYLSLMNQFKTVLPSDQIVFVEDLNRIQAAKMYYLLDNYSYKQIETIDDKLVENLKKVSMSPVSRTNFVTLLIKHLNGEKLDAPTLDKLATIPLSKLESALIQLKMDMSKTSLSSKISNLNLAALNTQMDHETVLIPFQVQWLLSS